MLSFFNNENYVLIKSRCFCKCCLAFHRKDGKPSHQGVSRCKVALNFVCFLTRWLQKHLKHVESQISEPIWNRTDLFIFALKVLLSEQSRVEDRGSARPEHTVDHLWRCQVTRGGGLQLGAEGGREGGSKKREVTPSPDLEVPPSGERLMAASNR